MLTELSEESSTKAEQQQLPEVPSERRREISENIKRIRYEIGEAIAKYRSSDEDIRIMAVTKTVPPQDVNVAIGEGLTLLGENRVQEYLDKKEHYAVPHELHIIGSLQSNKVKYIAADADMIQSVDSLKLASEINRQCEKIGRVMPVLCEVNIGGEESKGGIAPENVYEFLHNISQFGNIVVKGLMTIPPRGDSEKFFYKMQELFIDIQSKNIDNISMSVLSMGMSQDYTLGIKYGSNIVRIGTKLFGARI